tara:strand:+ start:25 stop:219 length:195 start_codon:yes stop_codon:yes gene_type:complete
MSCVVVTDVFPFLKMGRQKLFASVRLTPYARFWSVSLAIFWNLVLNDGQLDIGIDFGNFIIDFS